MGGWSVPKICTLFDLPRKTISSAHPTVDCKIMPGDIRCGIRQQINYSACNVLRLTYAFHRRCFFEIVFHLGPDFGKIQIKISFNVADLKVSSRWLWGKWVCQSYFWEQAYPGLILLALIPVGASSWPSCMQKDLTKTLVPPYAVNI